ncbi:hypothetical protein D2T29_12725 [Sinirhodobacter populi]|uniref:Uncharacterized protein n=1 Tax=Paenirhodobacter populi TaxID=2306993 RepID=A0A443KCG8_9RHOB|nr:hypothetical protein [Sinirhodobacter populi]RWR30529.1 hypothetical protein D2T29_12725 [Sinirhodobacter populi]
MTLEQFVEEEQKRLAAFSAWYRKKADEGEVNDDGSPVFPTEMGSGDWDEQYLFFDPADA